MEDWKGNTIKVGDIVIKVRYKNWFEGNKQSLGFLSQNGIIYMSEPTYVEPTYFWQIIETSKITEPSNSFTVKFNPEDEGETPINHLGSGLGLACNAFEMLCIKGISDNQDEFFKSLTILSN